MVEADRTLIDDDQKIFERVSAKPIIIVINKIDLTDGNAICQIPDSWGGAKTVFTSALYDRGIDILKEEIIETAFGKDPIDLASAIVPNLRQKALMAESLDAAEALNQALSNGTPMELVAIHLQEAIDSLGQILGDNVKVDLLEQIFSRFCIGK